MTVASNQARKGERRGIVKELERALHQGPQSLIAFVSEHSDRLPSSCWIWRHGKSGGGYAVISDPRLPPCRESQPRVLVHRLVCEVIHGFGEGQYLVRHTCDMPACVNLAHLLPGTHQDNCNDKIERGRAVILTGERNGRSTITNPDAASIRQRSTEPTAALAKEFGTSPKVVRRIRTGETWRGCFAPGFEG